MLPCSGVRGCLVLDEDENVVLLFHRTQRQIEIRAGDELVATFPLGKRSP